MQQDKSQGANAHVFRVDAAMPDMLPVINGECVVQAVRSGFGHAPWGRMP